MRLDIATAQKFEISREKAKKLILAGKILVDGNNITLPKFNIVEQEIICNGEIPHKNTTMQANHNITLDVIFEDDDILVINKQKDLMVHEGNSENFHTLANALLARYGEDFLSVGSSFRPGIVHRLDKNTTGLMVVAKNHKSYEILSQSFQNRTVVKKYLALCYGTPRLLAGTINANIGPDPQDRIKRKVLQIGGKEAITRYKTLKVNNGFCLLECTIETGRTHQIRVHLAHIGHPVVGDATYTKRKHNEFASQALHAHILEFIHPNTEKLIRFENSNIFSEHIKCVV